MSTDLEEIKQKISIVDLISQYLPLKKAGRNYRTTCPFHHEKTPSFMVSPERQIWHCFGCSAGGDHFGFVMKMENVEFPQALQILAEKAGVSLKKEDIRKFAKVSKEKEQIYELNELAANFFHHILLKTGAGKNALNYLIDRKLDHSSIKSFNLGYAPERLDLFHRFASKKGHSSSDLQKAGLVIKSEFASKSKTDYIDKFRGRIIFPIWDVVGNIVGFTGRLLRDKKEAPKYLNSPENPAFKKSMVIYGLNFARETIRKKNRVILVEGNTDVITAHKFGFKESVASSGTSTTKEQFVTLSRYSPNILLAFDNDEAGEAAAKRAGSLALNEGIEIKFIKVPVGKDPDECLQRDPKSFEHAVEHPYNLIEFLLLKFSQNKEELDTAKKRELAKELLPIIKVISDPILKGEYLQKLADTLNLKIDYLEDALRMSKQIDVGKRSKEKVETTKDYRKELEEKLLGMVLVFIELISKNLEELKETDFATPFANSLFRAVKKYRKIHKKFDKEDFLKKLPSKFRGRLDFLVLSVEGEFDSLEQNEIKCEFVILANKLLGLRKQDITKDFAEKIKEAEKQKDTTKIKKLLSDLQKQLKS